MKDGLLFSAVPYLATRDLLRVDFRIEAEYWDVGAYVVELLPKEIAVEWCAVQWGVGAVQQGRAAVVVRGIAQQRQAVLHLSNLCKCNK